MKDTTQDQLHALWFRIWTLLRKSLGNLDGDKVRSAINESKHPFWGKLAEAIETLLPTVRGVLTDIKRIKIKITRVTVDELFGDKQGEIAGLSVIGSQDRELVETAEDTSAIGKTGSYCFSEISPKGTMDAVICALVGESDSTGWGQAQLEGLVVRHELYLNPSEIHSVLTYLRDQIYLGESWPYSTREFFCFTLLKDGTTAIVDFSCDMGKVARWGAFRNPTKKGWTYELVLERFRKRNGSRALLLSRG
jgi:hypothetical protein